MTVSMREQGNKQDALEELKNFLTAFPDHGNGQIDLGCFHDENGRSDDAINCFSAAVAASPDNIPSRLNLIRELCDAGRNPESTSHLEDLANCGLNIAVDADDKHVKIALNGKPFYNSDKM